jgi:urate oxidase
MSAESMAETIVLGPASYGKSEVRLVKVARASSRHEIWDLNVAVALEGEFAAAYERGDNSGLLATDTMRNVVYAFAKEHPLDSIESFGLALARHFLASSPTVRHARVRLVAYPWERIAVDGRGHDHAFVRGAGERTAEIGASDAGVEVSSGLDNLLILKTTESGWEGYHFDKYTTLPETNDRIFATSLAATWSYGASSDIDFNRIWEGARARILATFTDHYSPSVQNTLYRMGKAVLEAYPEVRKIRFSLPNKHHLRFNLEPFGLANDNEIFHVTSEPYGLIEGTVERRGG